MPNFLAQCATLQSCFGMRASLLALWLLISAHAVAQSSAIERPQDSEAARTAEVKDKLQGLKSEIAAVNAVLGEKSAALNQSLQALREADLAISSSARQVRSLRTQAQQSSIELEALNLQANELNQALDNERASLRKLLRSAYAIGRMEQLKLALSQEKVAEIGRTLAYHSYINRARVTAIEKIQTSLASLVDLSAQIQLKQQEIEALIAAQLQSTQALNAQRGYRSEVIARLNAELQTGTEKLALLEGDRARLNALLERISDVLADIPKVLPNASALVPGKLRWPINSRRLMRNFGSVEQGSRPSTGIYLKSALGSEVHAVARGRVAFADWLRGFGLLLILDHGDGYISLYGHCETLVRSEGEWLETGDVLATSGAFTETEAQQTGLYFEWRKRGVAQNPLRWLSAK